MPRLNVERYCVRPRGIASVRGARKKSRPKPKAGAVMLKRVSREAPQLWRTAAACAVAVSPQRIASVRGAQKDRPAARYCEAVADGCRVRQVPGQQPTTYSTEFWTSKCHPEAARALSALWFTHIVRAL